MIVHSRSTGQQILATRSANLLMYQPLSNSLGATITTDASGNDRDGVSINVTLGVDGIGDGLTAALFNGTSSGIDAYSPSLAAAFNGRELTFSIWVKVASSGVWTDATNDRIVTFQPDANNRFLLQKTPTPNTLNWFYAAGGVSKSRSKVVSSPTGWIHMAITISKSADQMIAYYNGVQEGAALTGLGTFVGTLLEIQTVIGAQILVPTPLAVWNGYLAHAALWNVALTPGEVVRLAIVSEGTPYDVPRSRQVFVPKSKRSVIVKPLKQGEPNMPLVFEEPKDPNAFKDYVVRWRAWLRDDTIVASTWIAPDDITIEESSFTTAETTFWPRGGVADTLYTFTNRIRTAGGRTEDRTVQVRVAEQ